MEDNMKALLKKLMFLSLMMCVLSAWADDMPIGKKVKIHTKNGGIQEGVLKSADQEKAVLSVGKEDKTFMFSDVEKVVVSSNQLPVKLENEKEAKKGNNAMHRITPIALSFGDSSYGAEICGYEFISKGGFATRVTPLSFYFSTRDETVTTTRTSWGGGTYTYTGTYTDESFYWTPVWFRYYARKSSPAFWPYVGGTLAMHGFDDDEPTQLSDVEVEYTLRPAADFGFSFGGRVVRGDLGGKLFVGTGGDDKSLFMFNAGLSIGWGG
jgi:hypothetical protein